MRTAKFMRSLLLIIVAIVVMTISLNAVQPRWDIADRVDVFLSFDGNSGTAEVFIKADADTDNITATMTLYRLNNAGAWIEQMSWDYDVDASALSAVETFNGASGREYMLELTATVTKDGVSNSITRTVYEFCM